MPSYGYTALSASLLCLMLASVRASLPTTVVELHDDNFEHDTQASSGQTTGTWAVLFTDSSSRRHERAALVVSELAEDEDKEVIYAQVDVTHSKKLAKRFGTVLFVPCIVLLRDRKMYIFDRSFDAEDIKQQVTEFVTTGYESTTPLAVPEVRDVKLSLEAIEQSTQMDYKVVGWSILLIVGGLAFQAWAIMNKDKFKPEGPAKGKGAAATGSAPGPAAAAGSAGGGKKSE